MRPITTSAIALAALLCGTASAQRIEAESAYFNKGTVMTDEDGAEFVRTSGTTTFAFEAVFPASDSELVICTRAGGDNAVVDVRIDPRGAASAILRHTDVQDWTTTSIHIPDLTNVPVIVTIDITTSSEVDVNYFETCTVQDDEGPCDGCDLGPWAGTFFEQGTEKKVEFPAVGKLGEVPGVSEYTKIVTAIGITATKIDDAFGDQPIDGGCWMQRPEGAEECAAKECLPSRGCSFRSRVKFTPNNYARMPLTDSTEDVEFPDGSKKSYTRDSNPTQSWLKISEECNKSRHVVWKFENRGRVIQTITCLPCAGQNSSNH